MLEALSEMVVDITAVAHGGDGVGRIEGQVCFVPYALPGDRVKVRLTRQSKNACWAEIVEIIEPSPHRIPPACANHGVCGACLWGHFAYPAQAEWKQTIVQEAMARIAGVEKEVLWVEDTSLRLGYRTRAEFHGDGEKLGFFARGTHTIVDTESSPLCHDRINEALKTLRTLRLKGTVTVTANPEGEELMIWTRFTQRRLKQRFQLANTPKDEHTPLAQFVFDKTPIVNGTFSQSSLLLNRKLVKTVRSVLQKSTSVLDLYCGNGNLTINLPQRVDVVGVDHTRTATKAAKRLSKRDYRTGNEEKMTALLQRDDWGTIVLDPPRTGAKAIMPALAQSRAEAIVYVSCDPATLARDVKVLAESGWQVTYLAAVDMFPHTPHVETVCRLER